MCCCCDCCDDDDSSSSSGGGTSVVTTSVTATPTSTTVAAQPSCYYPNGMIYAPAMTCESEGDSTCCGTADDDPSMWVCMTNNLCKNTSDTSTKYERGGCTDPEWKTDKCLQACDEPADPANIFACSKDTYCCESSAGPGDFCCQTTNASELLRLGAAVPADHSVSIATDYLQAATSTSRNGPSATSSLSSQPTSDDHGKSSGVELGLGLGLGLPLGAAVIGGTIYFLRRRRNNNNNNNVPRGPEVADAGRPRRRDRNQQHGRREPINIDIPEIVQALARQLAAHLPEQPAQPRAPPRARTVSRGRERDGVVHHEVGVDRLPLYEDVLNEAAAGR